MKKLYLGWGTFSAKDVIPVGKSAKLGDDISMADGIFVGITTLGIIIRVVMRKNLDSI